MSKPIMKSGLWTVYIMEYATIVMVIQDESHSNAIERAYDWMCHHTPSR
jgi:hypothetical protein